MKCVDEYVCAFARVHACAHVYKCVNAFARSRIRISTRACACAYTYACTSQYVLNYIIVIWMKYVNRIIESQF